MAALRQAGSNRSRQDQHLGIRRRREHPQRGVRRHRQQPFDPTLLPLPPVPSAGPRWHWRPAWHRCAPAPTTPARYANPAARSAASSASVPHPAWCRTNVANWGGTACSSQDRWRAPCPDVCLCCCPPWSATMPARDPLATTVHGRTIRRAEDFATPARVDLSRLRVAITPDLGIAPTEQHIAEVFAGKTNLFRHVFAHAADTTHRIAPTPMQRSRCIALHRHSGAEPRRERAHPPTGCRPQRARQCPDRPPLLSQADVAHAGEATNDTVRCAAGRISSATST